MIDVSFKGYGSESEEFPRTTKMRRAE